ncbi:hypothetical protein CEXT_399251, partial [Caerostris extrusa]
FSFENFSFFDAFNRQVQAEERFVLQGDGMKFHNGRDLQPVTNDLMEVASKCETLVVL